MAKAGILHDYDLMANAEESAQKPNKCAVCGTENITYQWSDYSGEGMCCKCGCPYQLKWGSDEQQAEGNYPYLKLRENFIPIAKEFYEHSKLFVHYGASFSNHQGWRELNKWMAENHPDFE